MYVQVLLGAMCETALIKTLFLSGLTNRTKPQKSKVIPGVCKLELLFASSHKICQALGRKIREKKLKIKIQKQLGYLSIL